jgi:zinc protease
MRERDDPLRIEYAGAVGGLVVVRHPPPPGAASCSATYVGPAGWGFDPRGRTGVARLTNQLLTSGAGAWDRRSLARRLDRAGATLAANADPESGEVTIWGPADLWRPLLGILAEVVRRPRFDPADVARVRRQALERALRERTQPANRAEFEFLRAVFPTGHPYASTGRGTRSTLARIGRGDLVRFHERQYTGGDATLVVTAPASARDVVAAARARFSGLAESPIPSLRTPGAPPRRPQERRIDLPGRSQVEIRWGGPSIARRDEGYPAAFLANEILGGRPLLSRLFQRVRERGGLAYHASSALEAMRLGGYWVAQVGSGADRWSRVLPIVRATVDELADRPIRAAELDRIRESAIGQIPLALETTREAHELAVDLAYHRLPPTYWSDWPATLRAVRAREVRDAAREHLSLAEATQVVAGPLTPPAKR